MIKLIALAFCLDFGVDQCDLPIISVPEQELPVIYADPKYPRGRYAHGRYDPHTKTVYLNKRHIATLSGWELRELIYHELGHAYLGLKHRSDEGIMNPYNPKANYWVNKNGSNWWQLVNSMREYAKELVK